MISHWASLEGCTATCGVDLATDNILGSPLCVALAGTSVYGPELVFAKGTDGLYEIEPSMRWNPAVVAGVGMIPDPSPLYRDMHSYLASAGAQAVSCFSLCCCINARVCRGDGRKHQTAQRVTASLHGFGVPKMLSDCQPASRHRSNVKTVYFM